jgi:hypothetical protein
MNNQYRKLLFCLLLITPFYSHAQYLMDMIDTSKDAGRGMLGI